MIALISKEQKDTGGSTKNIIVEKLHKQQKFRLVVLLVVTIYMKILFESLVCIFSLFIIFRVVS